MSAYGEQYPSERPPQVCSRELQLSPLELLDICYLAKDLTDAALANEDNKVESATVLSGIRHDNSLLPSALKRHLNGTQFDNLTISLANEAASHTGLKVVARDSRRPDRTLTFLEESDAPYYLVEDSHRTTTMLTGREVSPVISRNDVSLWLASLATRSRPLAYHFLRSEGYNAANSAARLLTDSATMRYTSEIAQTEFLTGETLFAQFITQGDPLSESRYPEVRNYRTWVEKSYSGPFSETPSIPWLKSSTVVEFHPDAGVTVPEILNEGETSVRIEMETDPDADPAELAALTKQQAAKAAVTIIDSYQELLYKLRPVLL